jgi:hypothetical protein
MDAGCSSAAGHRGGAIQEHEIGEDARAGGLSVGFAAARRAADVSRVLSANESAGLPSFEVGRTWN